MTSILSQKKRVFNATNLNAIILKSKNIFSIFICISVIYIQLGILWKKRWASVVICFWNYRQQKECLLKFQKSPMSEHLRTVNMLSSPKHTISLHSSIFPWFFDQCERKSARKNLFWYYMKTWAWVWTYWHPMRIVVCQ